MDDDSSGSGHVGVAGVLAPADKIGGQYCANCEVGRIVPGDDIITPEGEGVREYALDPHNAEAL